jgi:hypothetical protein
MEHKLHYKTANNQLLVILKTLMAAEEFIVKIIALSWTYSIQINLFKKFY